MILNEFIDDVFFNDPTEKAYLYKVSIVKSEGDIIKTYSLDSEVKRKVIMPVTTEKVDGRTLVKEATLHTYKDLEFYDSVNGSDAIMWKDNLYLITAEYDRREYGFDYSLEYMNRDEVVIV